MSSYSKKLPVEQQNRTEQHDDERALDNASEVTNNYDDDRNQRWWWNNKLFCWMMFSSCVISFSAMFTQTKQYIQFVDHRGGGGGEVAAAAAAAVAAAALQQPPENIRRPYLVLHIGPGKAASTYIQEVGKILANANEFARDNYEFYGDHSGPISIFKMYDCPGYANVTENIWRNDDQNNCPTSKSFQTLLSQIKHRNHNVLFSNEYFWTKNATEFKLAIGGEQFDTRVIYIYRRLYDRVPSNYNEYVKKLIRPGPTYIWPSSEEKGGNPAPPSLLEWYKSNSPPHAPWFLNRTMFKIGQYAKEFPITVMPLDASNDADTDPMTRLICNFVPDANHTCSVLRNGLSDEQKSRIENNPSEPVDYDRIAVFAYEAGLIRRHSSDTPTRMDVFEKIKHYVEVTRNSTLNELPQTCLGQNELDGILDASWKYEQYLLGLSSSSSSVDHYHPASSFLDVLRQKTIKAAAAAPPPTPTSSDIDKFRSGFDSFVQKKKLCAVDVKRVVKDPQWVQFFSTL